jgi:membrane protease YdiL (CAAX protease family)
MKVLPKAYYDDGGVNERIFRRLTVPNIFFITMLVACAEELLFRGIIQSCFGLIAASFIFAAVHIRYWKHWYLIVNVVLLSFWLGLVYELSNENLLSTMMMHFTIDFLLGIRIKKWGT